MPDPAVEAAPVALVSMPNATLALPSLALSLLQALLRRHGLGARIFYPALWFAETVGLPRYRLCCHLASMELMVAEWVFAEAAFGEDAPTARHLLDHLRRHPGLVLDYGESAAEQERLEADLLHLRQAAPAFIDASARRILEGGARIVGCTSTFQQHVASLALLRRIRALDPGVVTVLGGANCEGPMGAATHRCFPWVDFVVSGDADAIVAPLFEAVLGHGRDLPVEALPPGVLGPSHRARPGGEPPARAVFGDLDSLPEPDFSDYFDAVATSPLRALLHPGLPVETSRGCWWADRRRCTFCGLNGGGGTYRAKSPARAAAEIASLQERYGVDGIETVDNVLDPRFLGEMLPLLSRDGRARRVFYEVRGGLGRGQVADLVRHGVTWVQPGIESLHSGLLRLMDKGVAAWQNVQLLKWAREYGLRLSWTLLWGFPGEAAAWYDEMAAFLPLLEHLQAPNGLIRLRIDRFSVYHDDPARFGLALVPVAGMPWTYPLPAQDLVALSYFFRDHHRRTSEQADRASTGLRSVREQVKRWRAAFWSSLPPILSLDDDGETLTILDTRSCRQETRIRLSGLERALLLACDEAPRADRLEEALSRASSSAVDPQALDAAVEDLRRRGLVLPLDGRLVALPVRGDLPRLPDVRAFPGGWTDYDRTAAAAPSAGSLCFAGMA